METNLSRRGFLTGAAAAGALAAMGLAGCAPTPAAEGGTKTADTGAAAATSWRDKPEMPTEFVETVDADIVVVGAGNGGLVAATTAAQNGAKVVVLEKAGAIAAAREAIGALILKLAPDHQEDVPTLLNHANQTQAGDANMLMYKTWAEKSGEMIEWMAAHAGPQGHALPLRVALPRRPACLLSGHALTTPASMSTIRTARTTLPTRTSKSWPDARPPPPHPRRRDPAPRNARTAAPHPRGRPRDRRGGRGQGGLCPG